MPCARSTARSATSGCAPTANDQYVEITADFRHYIDDPYVDPGFTRAPLTDEVDVVIVGGGFGGLLAGGAAARGRGQGHPHHREGRRLRRHLVLEPLSGRAVRHRELHLPAAAGGDRLHPEGEVQLRQRDPRALRSASASTSTSTDWPASRPRSARCAGTKTERWIVTTNRGDAMQARFVVMSSGPLNRPKLPGIPGIETFKGHTFHTSRWDYGYTGGDPTAG